MRPVEYAKWARCRGTRGENTLDARAAAAFHPAPMQVPLLDLKLQYAPLKSQILAEIEAVADSQGLILGPKTEAFEKAVAEYCGAAHRFRSVRHFPEAAAISRTRTAASPHQENQT